MSHVDLAFNTILIAIISDKISPKDFPSKSSRENRNKQLLKYTSCKSLGPCQDFYGIGSRSK